MDKKRTAIVTGGSGGIGSEICRRLAADGFNIVVHYGSNKDDAETVKAEIEAAGGFAINLKADVTDEIEIATLFEAAIEHFGGVDIVVANAGAMIAGAVETFEAADFDKLFAVNVRGAFLTLREAAKTLQDDGRIVFTSSQLAERPRCGTGVYSATKAAIDAMVVSMSKELGDRGISVNSVRPGATSPGMFNDSDEQQAKTFKDLSAFNRLGTPADIASVVSFLASEDGRWITGQHIRAGGGMSN